jgi:hypothetical protein
MPGDYLKHQRVVAHGTGHRTDMVEGEGERQDAAAADPAISRFHPGNATHRGRITDGTAGVGESAAGKKPAARPAPLPLDEPPQK